MLKANIISIAGQKRYELWSHSLRKYFRKQLGAISTIPTDFIEYWMEHTISTHSEVRLKVIENMRNLYTSSKLSIRPKTRLNNIQQLQQIIQARGINPNIILRRKTIIETLNQALKQTIIQEIREGSQKYI
jgi:hypothetical protein